MYDTRISVAYLGTMPGVGRRPTMPQKLKME
jgi:hypothetical protein